MSPKNSEIIGFLGNKGMVLFIVTGIKVGD
jgi:hypothetical protein